MREKSRHQGALLPRVARRISARSEGLKARAEIKLANQQLLKQCGRGRLRDVPLNFHPAAIRASAISIRQFTWREQPAEVGVPLCIRLAEAGHSLILAARNADRLQALANQLKGHDRHIAQAVGSFGETPGFHYGTKDFQLAVTSNIKSPLSRAASQPFGLLS